MVNEPVIEKLEKLYLDGKINLDGLDCNMGMLETVIKCFAHIPTKSRNMTLCESLDYFEQNVDVFDRYDLQINANREVFTRVYKVWVDLNAVRAREDNILTRDIPSNAPWKLGYEKSLTDFILDNGKAVSLSPNFYGWYNFEYDHRTLDAIGAFNVQEDKWSEFAGTGHDGDFMTGMTVDVVFKDGNSFKVRAVGELSEIIRKII